MNAMIRPKKISLEASTACQLRCPSCPTANGVIAKSIGTGFLRFGAFKKLIQDNPSIASIELSNWGEIFLNPDLEKIIEHAYQHNIQRFLCQRVTLKNPQIRKM
jgi:MoaA/NifB/PqqE/SkfB family radical SAM enzyme